MGSWVVVVGSRGGSMCGVVSSWVRGVAGLDVGCWGDGAGVRACPGGGVGVVVYPSAWPRRRLGPPVPWAERSRNSRRSWCIQTFLCQANSLRERQSLKSPR